jgi:predicted cupin superfamily sugar epimerase
VKLSPENFTAKQVIDHLGLEPLPLEGGFFRRTLSVPPSLSVIFYLLTPESSSMLHRLRADEIWCFQAGDAIELLLLSPDGSGEQIKLGSDLGDGQHAQALVPAGTWQGAQMMPGGRWALATCVCSPEFVQKDFELGDGPTLCAAYPRFADVIRLLHAGT